MRARLSEDIRDLGYASRFQRVGPNRFALRAWRLPEYVRPPIERHELTACIKQDDIDNLGRFFGFSRHCAPYAKHVSDRRNIHFVERTEAESRDDLKQLISYVMLRDSQGNVLTYRRGAHSTAARFLVGSYCVGFGGHVVEEDVHSLFGFRDGGIINCAYREVGEELRGLSPRDLELVGVINDDSSPNGLRHFAFVFSGHLPGAFKNKEQRHEAAIADLDLLSPRDLWERYHELEFWSQLLVANFFEPPSGFEGVYFSQRRRQKGRWPIVVVGEIAAGKTEVASYLANSHNIPSVSTRECVASLINAKDFGTGDRSSFQEKAAVLVSTDRGLDELAGTIASRVDAYESQLVLVDGVRNVGTLERLQRIFPRLLLVYVDAPKDTAFRFFCSRKGGAQELSLMTEFRNARNHSVERDVPLLKYRSNRSSLYIFNNGPLESLRQQLDAWVKD
jgi:predicted NUDIX family phosphoesterase/adenylate kinase family enzyme